MNNIKDYSEKFYSGSEDILENENILIKKLLLQELNKDKKEVLFDFGCGSGDWLDFFVQFEDKVYATDKSIEAMDFVKKMHQYSKVDFLDFDEKKIKLEDFSVDIITVFWVFQEILNDDEMDLFLEEFDRILKTNGIIVVIENRYSDIRKFMASTRYGDMLIDSKGNILRQFPNNTVDFIFGRLNYRTCKHQEFGMSFFEIFQKINI